MHEVCPQIWVRAFLLIKEMHLYLMLVMVQLLGYVFGIEKGEGENEGSEEFKTLPLEKDS